MSNITRFVFVRYDGDLAGVATVAALALLAAIGGCARDAVVPTSAPPRVPGHAVRAVSAPPVPVTSLLDSFSIGDYTVLPRGGYAGGMWYARSPEKDLYAGTINNHPTGLVVPVGLPIRVLAEGRLISRSTAAFQTDYCARSGGWDPNCGVGAFEYSVHGLAPWYEAGTGLSLTWFPNAGYYDRFFGFLPAAEFFSGWVPSSGALTHRELYIRRLGCCYSISSGSAAWETYEGVWRLGVVPFDGGQAELGVPAVLRLSGPRTDGPMAAPADFTVSAANGDLIDATRWWYVRPAHNVFNGERVDSVPTGTPYPPFLPRYPDAQRSLFTEIGACAGQTTCTYQAMEAGVVLVQATLLDRLVQRIPWVFAARNTGRSGAHVKITADSTTLAYGDTTVFRVTAPGATRWWVTEYSFMPVGAVATSAVQAVRGPAALRKASLAAMSPEGVRVVRGRTTARFRDAALACSEATIELCYDFPPQTGYEIVTALVDGEVQRDSVLVTVVPVLRVTCSPAVVVRAAIVSCTAVMSDSTAFTPTHQKSWTGTTVLVDVDIVGDSAVSSYTWAGKAILSTELEISGVHSGVAVRGLGSFRALPRTGAEWTDLRITGPAPSPEFVGDPLPEDPFTIDSSLVTTEGALGQNEHVLRSVTGIVADGPNANLLYMRQPATLAPSRTFVHAWLQKGSAFYRRQRGNPNVVFGVRPCSGQDIDRLRNAVIAHEERHFTAAQQYFDTHDVQAAVEAATAPFFGLSQLGTPDGEAAMEAATDAALTAVWNASWIAAFHTAVDSNYPVQTPSCKRQ